MNCTQNIQRLEQYPSADSIAREIRITQEEEEKKKKKLPCYELPKTKENMPPLTRKRR